MKVIKKYLSAMMRTGEVDIHIERETHIGVWYTFRERMPKQITHYPIIPIFVEDTENPYKRGEVTFVKGMQKFLNKAYGVMLLNAQLMSNPKLIMRENDIPDGNLEAFQTRYANPGSVNIISQNAEDPIVINGQPLNSAFFDLYHETDRSFEQATLPRDMLGYTDSSRQIPQSFLLDVRELVLDTFKDFAGNIEAALSRLGMVTLQYCQAYLTTDRVLRLTDGHNRVNRLRVNYQEGLDLNDNQSVQNFIQQKLREGVSESDIQMTLAKAKEDEEFLNGLSYLMNSIDSLDVDIAVIPGSYAPSYDMAQLRLNLELYQAGVVDNQSVLEHVPTENREQLIQRLDVIQQQTSQIESMEEAMGEMDSQIKSLQKQLVKAGVDAEMTEARTKIDGIVKEHRLQARNAKQQQRLKTQSIIDQTKLDAKELLMDLKLQTAKENDVAGPGVETQDMVVSNILAALAAEGE